MDPYKETFETWNKVAIAYQERIMDLDLYNTTYDFFCDSIGSKNAKILEVGCGPGNITRYLLNKRSHFEILGIDIAPSMIDLASKNNPTASFSVLDVRQIDQLKTQFDGIICGFCIPYLSLVDVQKLMADFQNLSHDNCVLYLSFVGGNPNDSGFQISSSGDRVYFYYHHVESIKSMLANNHFTVMKEFMLPFINRKDEVENHIILVAKKC